MELEMLNQCVFYAYKVLDGEKKWLTFSKYHHKWSVELKLALILDETKNTNNWGGELNFALKKKKKTWMQKKILHINFLC